MNKSKELILFFQDPSNYIYNEVSYEESVKLSIQVCDMMMDRLHDLEELHYTDDDYLFWKHTKKELTNILDKIEKKVPKLP